MISFMLHPVNAATIQEVLQLALIEDSEYKQARFKSEQADADEVLARSSLLPQLSATASKSRNRLDVKESTSDVYELGEQKFKSNEINLKLTQTIYEYGKWALLDQKQALMRKSIAEMFLAKQALILKTVEVYGAVLLSEAEIKRAKSALSLAKQTAENLKNRYEIDSAMQAEYLKAQARLDLSYADTLQAENALLIARRELYNLTGKEISSLQEIDNTEILIDKDKKFEDWFEQVHAYNSEIMVARENYTAALELVKSEWSKHFPSLDLIAQYTDSDEEGGSIGGLVQDETTVILQLSIPVFSSGATNARVSSAEAAKKIAYEEYIRVVKKLEGETRKVWSKLQESQYRLSALKNAHKSAMLVTQAFDEGVKTGRKTQAELLEVKNDQEKTEIDLMKMKQELVMSKLTFLKLSGQLKPEVFGEVY